MKIIISLAIFFFFGILSCNNANKHDTTITTIEKIANLAIATHDGTTIELPDIHDSLLTQIPEKDSIKFSNILKFRGFKLKDAGWGNHMRGPHLLQSVFLKDNCECTVTKTYYTIKDSLLQVSESINCKTVTAQK